MRRSGAWRAGAGLALLLLGCGSTLDLDRARHLLERPPPQGPPPLEEEPRADLAPPEGLRAWSGELRSVPLQWEPLLVGEVGGYVIERSEAREGPFARLAVVPDRLYTVYVDDDAVPAAPSSNGDAPPSLDGATFFYRVRAYTPAGRVATATSPVVAATTVPAPEPPEDVRAYSYQPREVPLSWRASEDVSVDGYVVERSPTSIGPFEPIADVHGRHDTAYLDTVPGDLRVVYYRIAARNEAGATGAPSEPVRAVTKPEPLPPVGLQVAGQWLGMNRLVWEPNVEEDIVAYRLLRTRAGSEGPERVAEVPGDRTHADDAQVSAGESVRYALVAIDRDGLESEPSEPVRVESEGYGLTAVAHSDGVHLSWRGRADEGYTGARVFRRGMLGERELAFVSEPAYVDPQATPGGTYRYSVALERPDGTRAPRSATVEIHIPAR